MAKKKCNTANIEDIRHKKKEAERRRRENIKSNPILYEEQKRKERERYQKRKEEGKIKFVNDLTRRERKAQRTNWLERTKRFRQKKKENEKLERQLMKTTISDSDDDNIVRAGPRKILAGRKKIKINQSKAYRLINKLEKQLVQEKRKASRYKMKFHRLRKEERQKDTPRSKLKKFLAGEKVSPNVVKRLQFGEVLTTQIARNYRTNNDCKARQAISRAISGKIIKKYRCLSQLQQVLPYKTLQYNEGKDVRSAFVKRQYVTKYSNQIQKDVIVFFEKDEVSRIGPGKKDCITFKKTKKQRRVLNESLHVLHKQFNQCHTYQIPYSSFCSLRPFWVQRPNIRHRDTCLCRKHENFRLMFEQLKRLNVIDCLNPHELVNALCCDKKGEDCLERNCTNCMNKVPSAKEFQDKEIIFQQWSRKKESVTIKGKESVIMKVRKENITSTLRELFNLLLKTLPQHMQHISNIEHQYKVIDNLKQNLNVNELLIHIDFSENYECKYSREIQSMHFGGSHDQVTLHTGVLYYRECDSNLVKSMSFCTMSECMRHDASAICAHLEQILTYVQTLLPPIRNIHFLSDGPSTQYRNKKMFFFIMHFLSKFSQNTITWNYSESGHGKGAPDGVGGSLKRMADQIVAEGKDVACYKTLVEQLSSKSNVKIFSVTLKRIEDMDTLLPPDIPGFKGTMQTHQVTWSHENSNLLQCRRLSCFSCAPNEKCIHYNLGRYLNKSVEVTTNVSTPEKYGNRILLLLN